MEKTKTIFKVLFSIAGMMIGGSACSMIDGLNKKQKIQAINDELERLHKLAEKEVEATGKMSIDTSCRLRDLVWKLERL